MASETKNLNSGGPEYNVLLLGETGAGKSTFINAFGLYLQHETCEEMGADQPEVLVPTKFSVRDDYKNQIEVNERKDEESLKLRAGESETKWCGSYLFGLDSCFIRLIDTPGMGSTVLQEEGQVADAHAQSVAQDKEHVETIVRFISNFQQLHAIAVFVKASETRYSTRFDYCLKSVMSNLHRSAIHRLVFVLNFSVSTNFGEPAGMKDILQKITSCETLASDRLMMFDHEGFRYALAKKHGARYKALNGMLSQKSWKKSRKSCVRFVDFVTGQESSSYAVHDTLSIVDARNFITHVEPAIQEILRVQKKNQELMSDWSEKPDVDSDDQLLKYMHAHFYSSAKVIKLEQPITTCQSEKCLQAGKAEKKVCCQGCQVSGSDFVRRFFCSAFQLRNGNCKVCGCHVSRHQRVYYEMQEEDSDEDLCRQLRLLLRRDKQLDSETMKIESAVKQFRDFLATNPIYSGEFDQHQPLEKISPANVNHIRDELFRLDIHGAEIKNAYEIACAGRKKDAEKYFNEEKFIIIVRNSHRDLEFTPSSKSPLAPRQD